MSRTSYRRWRIVRHALTELVAPIVAGLILGALLIYGVATMPNYRDSATALAQTKSTAP